MKTSKKVAKKKPPRFRATKVQTNILKRMKGYDDRLGCGSGDIARGLGLAQATVLENLRLLEKAGKVWYHMGTWYLGTY